MISPLTHRIGYLVLLMQLDLFTIWMIGLLVIGVSIVGKEKRSSAAFGILGVRVVWIVIRTAVGLCRYRVDALTTQGDRYNTF